MDDDELRRLLAEVRGAMRAVARRYPPHEYDDLMSVGMVAAWAAYVRGERTGRRLITKAQWAMQDYLRSVKPGKRRGGAIVLHLEDLREAINFEPRSPGPRPDELADAHARARALKEAVKRLPERLRFVVEKRLSGWPNTAIAKKLGITEPRVTQLVGEAVHELGLNVDRGRGSRTTRTTRPPR